MENSCGVLVLISMLCLVPGYDGNTVQLLYTGLKLKDALECHCQGFFVYGTLTAVCNQLPFDNSRRA